MANLKQSNVGYRIGLTGYLGIVGITAVTGITSLEGGVSDIYKSSSKYLVTQFIPTDSAGPGSSTKLTTYRIFTPWTDVSGPLNAIGVSNQSQIEFIGLDKIAQTVTFNLFKANV